MEAIIDNVDARSERTAPNEGRLEGILPSDGAKRRSSERSDCEWILTGEAQGVRFLAIGWS